MLTNKINTGVVRVLKMDRAYSKKVFFSRLSDLWSYVALKRLGIPFHQL